MKAIVTDDSRATRMILGKLLGDLGFEVQLAEDGPALFDLLNLSLIHISEPTRPY